MSKKWYIWLDGKEIPVTEEVYRTYINDIIRTYKNVHIKMYRNRL